MGTAKISSKGQVAIPAALREAIGLRPGAEVSFELAGSAILLRPVPQFKSLMPKQGYGCIPTKVGALPKPIYGTQRALRPRRNGVPEKPG